MGVKSQRSDQKKRRKTVEKKLEENVKINKYYPFLFKAENDLELTVRHWWFYWGVGGQIASLIPVIYLASTFSYTQAFFILPIITLIISIAVTWSHRNVNTYKLEPLSLTYHFSHGQKVQTSGKYYNLYIRLRRDLQSNRQKKYHLVLNGYRIDSHRLCGSTRNMKALRRLGQTISENLNINYFDEANTSKHHIIRHFKKDAEPQMFIN